MSLWSMLAAPLIAGNDLRTMTPAIREILTNREVIAIDQDAEGKQAKRAWKSGDQEIWTRPLAGGDEAVALFNRSESDANIDLRWSDFGIRVPKKMRDLWAHSDILAEKNGYSAKVPAHAVVLLRLSY
jgi:alpha-galactosidase